jgi:hypothetical protein
MTLLLFLLIFCTSFVTAQSSIDTDYKTWKPTQCKDNITSYLGTVKVKNATPTKVKMTIDVTPQDFIEAVTNFDKYHVWILYCTKSSIVKTINENECYAYYYISTPMASDRDVYVHSTVFKKSATSYEVIIADVPHYKSENKDVVRIPHFYSHYFVSVDNNGKTQVTHINETALGGSLPAFLLDWSNHSQPFNTMKTLRKCIINKNLKKHQPWLRHCGCYNSPFLLSACTEKLQKPNRCTQTKV